MFLSLKEREKSNEIRGKGNVVLLSLIEKEKSNDMKRKKAMWCFYHISYRELQ